jgi:hypothetical protein
MVTLRRGWAIAVCAALLGPACSRRPGSAQPSTGTTTALPPGAAAYAELDIFRLFAGDPEERKLLFALVPSGCIDALQTTETISLAWYDGDAGGLVLGFSGPTEASVRGCLEKGLGLAPQAPPAGAGERAKAAYDGDWLWGKQVLVSRGSSEHLLVPPEMLPRLAGGQGSPSLADDPVMKAFRAVPEAPLIAAAIIPPDKREVDARDIRNFPFLAGVPVPTAMALGLRPLEDDLAVNVAALAATDADARAMEQGARQVLAKGRTMIEALLKDPTQPSGYKLVLEIIDTVSLSVEGTTVRGSATLGTGLGMLGLLSAVAIPAFLRYTVEAREAAVEERVAVDDAMNVLGDPGHRAGTDLELEQLAERLETMDADVRQAEQARHECEQKLEEVLSQLPDPVVAPLPPPAGPSRQCINEGTPLQECFTCPGDPRCG